MLTAGKWIAFNRPEDRMIFGLEQEASSHRYALDLSAAVRPGKRAAAAKGLFNGGKPPYGYRVEGRKLVPDPAEADTLRWLFETYATTDVSTRGLADRLRERNVPSPGGCPLWRPSSIRQVLGNVLYLGSTVFNRKTHSPFSAVKVKAGRRARVGRPNPEAEWSGRASRTRPW
jgi:hypothetical protein